MGVAIVSYWVFLALASSRGVASALEPAEPASVGMNADRLAQIRPRMQEFIDEGQISGAVALVARQGRIVHLNAVGLADRAEKRPMRNDTIFWIASMTEPVTATGVMILHDQGRLSVLDPVASYLPEFKDIALSSGPPARPITIRDLLTHTSGVAGSAGGPSSADRSLAEHVRRIAKQPLQFEPGTKWQYSSGLTVAARIIEVVSDQPYDEFIRQRILIPLNMRETGFYPSPDQR